MGILKIKTYSDVLLQGRKGHALAQDKALAHQLGPLGRQAEVGLALVKVISRKNHQVEVHGLRGDSPRRDSELDVILLLADLVHAEVAVLPGLEPDLANDGAGVEVDGGFEELLEGMRIELAVRVLVDISYSIRMDIGLKKPTYFSSILH